VQVIPFKKAFRRIEIAMQCPCNAMQHKGGTHHSLTVYKLN